jgi:hypothetical protein
VTWSLVPSSVMASNRERQGHTVTGQCVTQRQSMTQRQSEVSSRYLAVPLSALPITASLVMQPCRTLWSGTWPETSMGLSGAALE